MKDKLLNFFSLLWKFIKDHKKQSIFLSISGILFLIFEVLKKIPSVCEFVFARNISRFFHFIISRITNIFPFSLTQWVYVFGGVLIVFLLIKIFVYLFKKNWASFSKLLYKIVSVSIILVLSLNVLFTFSYNRYPVLPYLGLDYVEPSMELAVDSADFFITKAKALEDNFERTEKGEVISPYSYDTLVKMINEEFSRLDEDYFSSFYVKSKPVFFSRAMSYLGITGIYFPYLAESNINTDVSDYTIPVTICHEMAHAKGVMRENEANYIAYYLLMTSEDEFLQYLGFMRGSIIMLNETFDPENTSFYVQTYEKLSPTMLNEFEQSSLYWDDFDTIFDKISTFFNDLYLKSQGVSSGVKSYSQTGSMLMSLYVELS